MIDVEPLIQSSFDRMLPERAAPTDWADVLGRAGVRSRRAAFGTPRKRFVVVALALMALVVVVGAAAYALGHPIVRFDAAPRATSRTIVNYFGQMTVDAVPTPVLPHQARLITEVQVDGRNHRLFVAPVRGGGFCYEWTGSAGSCASEKRLGERLDFMGAVQGAAGTEYQGREFLTVISGLVPSARAARVVLHYADGQSADIPFVWVTAPIRTGFFLYGIPTAHQRLGHQPVRISLVDSSGAAIASQRLFEGYRIPKARPRSQPLVTHQPAGYPTMNVPARAEWTKRKQLFSLRADTGTRVGLWIAPSRTGGTCWWSNVHAGCGKLRPGSSGITKLRGDSKLGDYVAANNNTGIPHYLLKTIRGHGYVALCCTLDPSARHVKLLFQDGRDVTLAPKHGYLIWPIPRRRYRPGHRLEEVDLYGRKGAQIGAVVFQPDVRGFYPCTKPKNYGYGLRMCP